MAITASTGLKGDTFPVPSSLRAYAVNVAGRNWAMPSAPAEETADGFQPDSASICAARSGADIPGHREPASSRTGIRAGMGTADVARTAAVDGLLAPLAATATSPTTPK